MRIRNKVTTRNYDAPDAGIKGIVGMHASLRNVMYVEIPFLLILDFVPNGKVIQNLVPDGFIRHFVNILMTKRIPYRKRPRARRKILSWLLPVKH